MLKPPRLAVSHSETRILASIAARHAIGGCAVALALTHCSGSPVLTPQPTARPSASAAPTSTPTATPSHSAAPSSSPIASSSPSASPSPTAAPSSTPTPSPTPTPTPTPSPTPSPTPTPTPTPTPGAIVLSTNAVQLLIGGSTTSQVVNVSQSNVRPMLTPTLSCTVGANSAQGTVATITPSTGQTPTSVGGSVSFTIALASSSPTAGTCTGSFASSAGGTAAPFTVTVTATQVIIQSRGRR